MLKVSNLEVSYGGIEAIKGVDINVEKGKIVTLVGANGAGKSTVLRTIVGLVKMKAGNVVYKGEDLSGVKTQYLSSKGLTLVPEGRRIFSDLTVKENLYLGAYARKDKVGIEKDITWVYDLFPILKDRQWQLGGTLSGGEQQMLAVGRALMSRPDLLMMDEPSLGLAPLIVKDIFSIIKEINKKGVTILLIEQNANLALKIADYGYVMETGKIIMEGIGKDLLCNEDIKKAYLGESV